MSCSVEGSSSPRYSVPILYLPSHVVMPCPWVLLTRQHRAESEGAAVWRDAADDAVEQEADVLALRRRQEEDARPWGEKKKSSR